MLKALSKVVAAAALLTFAQLGQAQQKLTILWAQWDPANYLQELVKDYEKASGVKVVVETTPWPDFQNKAFKEFTARRWRWRMPWARTAACAWTCST